MRKKSRKRTGTNCLGYDLPMGTILLVRQSNPGRLAQRRSEPAIPLEGREKLEKPSLIFLTFPNRRFSPPERQKWQQVFCAALRELKVTCTHSRVTDLFGGARKIRKFVSLSFLE